MLVKEINQRELLNTLTDAGLIPNYAFPEAGVELKSVLWRKKGSDDVGEGAYVALPAIKYERPASSAISEFAPENRFYANQRRVEVDQINMSLANLEDWRLCPACHHMELLGPQAEEHQHTDTHANCPRCGDAMWSNISQRRPLLRFKQAIANSDDTRVRIDDSAEDREPKFYTRQLLVDVDPADVRHAWRIRTDSLPFGFEFITRANFRDINFGELGKAGENFKVADKESQRPGFKLCRHCGKVQLPPRRSDREEKKQDHAFDCEKRGAEDASSIIECLYLYREFSSEALRILVPYTQSGIDDEVVQSFIAALQLGLKKRFGGKVDHLRITTQDEPGREGGPRRQYVLLYDSVPGGTGYLEQLLSEDAQTLTDVLKMARDALHACSCNQNPEKDGCYRCLYQYRLGRSMAMVSRRRAAEVLDELLGKLDQLEQVKNISEIYINPNFDSALEARFIESLKRLGGKAGIPHSKLVGEIIKGKSGYLLEIGGQRYWVEPQGKEVMSNDIVWWSNPDFVIWPTQSKSPRRPIAVFCDGWAYHHSILREDARKRSALLASGKFGVWSVTHEDVKQALLGEDSTDLDSPLLRLARNDGAAKTPDFLKPDAGAFQSNAVAQLLSWLAMPVEPDFDPGESKLRRNAVALTFRMLSLPNDPEHEVLKAELAALQTHWPSWIEVPSNAAAAGSKECAAPVVRMWWPQAFGKSGATADLSPGMVLLDDDAELPEKERQLVWRQWLQLFNHLQVLSGVFLATRRGIQGDDYLPLLSPTGFGSPSDSPSSAQEQAWAAALDSAMAITHGGLAVLQSAGSMPPDEIGFELQDEAGEVCAEAELAWSSSSVLLLLEHQAEHLTQWQSAGWTVIQNHDGWAEQVLARLSATEDTQ
jgi:DEAD/DEAH box helicase domain-containing protein